MTHDQVKELLNRRIPAAITSITAGHGPMQIPVNDEDVDVVLAECKTALTALLAEHEALETKESKLKELIVHMWVHDGYRENGRSKMDSELKQLYDSVIAEAERG